MIEISWSEVAVLVGLCGLLVYLVAHPDFWE